MLETFLSVLLLLALLINPPGQVPVFISLTQGTPESYKRRMAIKGCATAWGILLVFGFVGQGLLDALGISLPAFRVGGGLLLAVTGFRMVLEQRQKLNQQRAEEHQPVDLADIAVFPIATLFLAGPGAITAVMLMMNEHGDSWLEQLMIVAAISLLLGATLLMFLLSNKISDYLPESIVSTVSRILGMLLIALSVQFVFDGIRQTFFQA